MMNSYSESGVKGQYGQKVHIENVYHRGCLTRVAYMQSLTWSCDVTQTFCLVKYPIHSMKAGL